MNPFICDVLLGKIDNYEQRNRIQSCRNILHQPPNFRPLNHDQQFAINYALKHRFCSIQGPPGTGKTTTISALAYSFVKSGKRPIFVCAHTNVATDFCLLTNRGNRSECCQSSFNGKRRNFSIGFAINL